MITIAIFNAIVVYYAILAKSKKSDYWLKLSFVFVFMFLALRYQYGNDYMAYFYAFSDIHYYDAKSRYEPGWQILCLLFKPLGFFAMTAFLAAFNCIIYYRFIKNYVPPVYYWVAVFIYVFNPYFMLVHSSAMRQSIAIAIFLFSVDYIYKKDIIRYSLCIIFASLFHASAIILLPLYLIFIIDWKITRIRAVLIFVSFIAFLFNANNLAPYVNRFIETNFEKYSVYQDASELGSGIGLLYYIAVLVIILIYAKKQYENKDILFKLSIASYYVIPLGFIVALMSRVGMYLQPVMMAVIPIILINIQDKKLRFLFLSSYLLMTLYSFYFFFQSDVWRDAFGTYKTILSAPKIY